MGLSQFVVLLSTFVGVLFVVVVYWAAYMLYKLTRWQEQQVQTAREDRLRRDTQNQWLTQRCLAMKASAEAGEWRPLMGKLAQEDPYAVTLEELQAMTDLNEEAEDDSQVVVPSESCDVDDGIGDFYG